MARSAVGDGVNWAISDRDSDRVSFEMSIGGTTRYIFVMLAVIVFFCG